MAGTPGGSLAMWLPKGKLLFPDKIFPARRITTPAPDNVRTSTTHRYVSHPDLINSYAAGHSGVLLRPGSRERLLDVCLRTGGYKSFEDAATANGFADVAAGQLVIPYIYQVLLFPGCLPGAAQERGDCVSHASSGAQRATICGDIVGGLVDELLGIIEGVPDIDPLGILDGVTSSEFNYWLRGYNGDGWDCDEAMAKAIEIGCMLRNNYPDLGIDLRQYSGRLAGKYGAQSPPGNIQAAGKLHRLHSGAPIESKEGLRDALANGHGVQSCGNEGFSSTRRQWGYSPPSGSWSHGYKNCGYDDRPGTIKLFGEPMVLNDNNWGEWNSGDRDILDSAQYVPAVRALARRLGCTKSLEDLGLVNPKTGNLQIMPGMWWCKWSETRRRSFFCYSGIAGWKRKRLPDFGGSLAG